MFGIQLNAISRYSRSLDDAPSGSFEATPENVFNRRIERAVTDFVPVHSLRATAGWDQSSRPRKSGFFLNLVSHPYLLSSLSFDSGLRYDVLAGLDANHDGNPLTDRPLGVSRNAFLGQRFFGFNTSFGFRPLLTDSSSMRLSIDVFNLFNHTNFSSFDTVLQRADLSGLNPNIPLGRERLPSFDFHQPLTPSGFGAATKAFDPRRLQLGLRFTF